MRPSTVPASTLMVAVAGGGAAPVGVVSAAAASERDAEHAHPAGAWSQESGRHCSAHGYPNF